MTYLPSFFKISLIDLLVPMEDDLICALIFVEFFCNAFAINDSLFLAFRDNELDDSIEPCQRKNRYTCKLIFFIFGITTRL